MTVALGVPSKGRLEEETRRVFAAAGLVIDRAGGVRSYTGSIDAMPEVTVRFAPAGEIARDLVSGALDMGVTGADLIYEVAEGAESQVAFARPLGFGAADVVVAVPDCWMDVVRMVDLADVASDFRARHGRWLRIATKYTHLTRRQFEKFGIAEYRIVDSTGATEAAPASGHADLIVDITSSGETLAANALRVLDDGVILRSEANLMFACVVSGEKRAMVDRVLERFTG